MMRLFHSAVLALLGVVALTSTQAAWAQPQTCSGEFVRDGGSYMVEWCPLSEANAKKLMKVCSIGQPCVITGIVEHCRNVRGACAEMTQIISARWGDPLPACSPTDAAARADQYWSDGSSIIVRGTITETADHKADRSPPYGHTTIVMDLTTCNTGSPMAVDRVSETYIGHYVDLKGTAKRGPNGWYIIARQIDDAPR